jgi:dTMP kinase
VNRGQLISFEGLDGAGKTTQMQMLEEWLASRRVSYLRTREPGGTALGAEIRHLLFGRPDLVITPLAEAFLFQADRAQHFSTVILPALELGTLVITDRCFDSSIAYQGVARGVGAQIVEQLSLLATQGKVPDLTIVLDLDPALVHQRVDMASQHDALREEESRFDRETEQFHQRVRQAFLSLARKYPERMKVINASQPPERIHREIVALVEPLLRQ